MWIDWLTGICVVVGVFFMFVSSFGIWRLPDFYMRVHTPTKAATLGLFSLLLAVVLHFWDGIVVAKSLLVLAFIGATMPLGAHILTRAAYRTGMPSTRHEEEETFSRGLYREGEASYPPRRLPPDIRRPPPPEEETPEPPEPG